jgi:hypothetical protein
MTEDGDKLLQRYRALDREEPPPAIDVAILAASRRAVRSGPKRQWAGPVSIAAVLVLGIGVSLRMQLEDRADYAPPAAQPVPQSAPAARPEPSLPEAAPVAPAAKRKALAEPDAMTRQDRASTPAAGAAKAPAPAPAAPMQSQRVEPRPFADEATPASKFAAPPAARPAAPPAVATDAQPATPAAAGAAPMRAKSEAARSNAAESRALSTPVADPRALLERIAKLREEGRDAEADQALEEFERLHPGYAMDDAMRQRVKRR